MCLGWKNSKAEGERDIGFSKARPWGARDCWASTTTDRTNKKEESKGNVRENGAAISS